MRAEEVSRRIEDLVVKVSCVAPVSYLVVDRMAGLRVISNI